MNELEANKKRVANVQMALARERELKKPKPNQRMAEEIPDRVESYAFWCDDCQKDFDAPAYKESHHIFEDVIITYRAACSDCGQECVRFISHRDLDPYYFLSDRIREDRNRYREDFLRHDDFGFETAYGYKFKEYDDNLKAREARKLGLERQKGFKLSKPI